MIEFQRTTKPPPGMLASLDRGFDNHVDVELQRNLRDVQDHLIRIVESADAFRAVLQNALTVHASVVGQRQTTRSAG